MKKYQIYRALKDRHIDQDIRKHELIDVVFGEDIDEIWDEIEKSIKNDLEGSEENIWENYGVKVEYFNPKFTRAKRYNYAALGILYPDDVGAPKNLCYEYGIREMKHNEEPAW